MCYTRRKSHAVHMNYAMRGLYANEALFIGSEVREEISHQTFNTIGSSIIQRLDSFGIRIDTKPPPLKPSDEIVHAKTTALPNVTSLLHI